MARQGASRSTNKEPKSDVSTSPAGDTPPPNQGAEPSEEALNPPQTPDALHAWIVAHLDVHVLRAPLVPGHAAPFDYVVHAFFEGNKGRFAGRSPDCVVWANRGGGKTFLGALVTLLELIFKPGVQIRLLGGSLDQSRRMQEHLHRFAQMPRVAAMCEFVITRDRVEGRDGAAAEVLAASQTSVRGTRVQKVRCDEVDLFDADLWEAVQLTTRSIKLVGPWGDEIKGSVDALSTMHRPFGLMWKLVGMHLLGRSTERGGPESAVEQPAQESASGSSPSVDIVMPRPPIFRWGVLDALERCDDDHACEACALVPECAGRAKLERLSPEGQPAGNGEGAFGHITIDDAIRMKSRVGRATWEAEMLCLRPRRDDSVYPEFDASRHVVDDADLEGDRARLGPFVQLIAGMDFGFRAEGVVLLAGVTRDKRVVVVREHCKAGLKLADHIQALRGWLDENAAPYPGLERGTGLAWVAIDPAGNSIDEQTGDSNAGVLRKANFVVRAKGGTIDSGVNAVRDLLDPAFDPHAGGGDPSPKLFIHQRCARLIECMHRYRYPEHDKQTLIPLKTEGVDHACDALRYMIINLLRRGKTGWTTY